MSEYYYESFVGAFIGGIEYDWERVGFESPTVVANRIDAINSGLSDMTAPMQAARQILVDSVEQRFDTETDPSGVAWPEWSEEYAKRTTSSQILRLSDDLYQSATDPLNYPIVGDSLWVNFSNFPPYWNIHQQGGVAGKGAQIPQRAYIGLSDEAALDVIDFFDAWALGEVRTFSSPMTGILQAFEGTRFGARVGMGHGFQSQYGVVTRGAAEGFMEE